jgi:hypothetical protein
MRHALALVTLFGSVAFFTLFLWKTDVYLFLGFWLLFVTIFLVRDND